MRIEAHLNAFLGTLIAAGSITAAMPWSVEVIARDGDGTEFSFGQVLAADDGRLLAGAPFSLSPSGVRTGAAYLIDLATGTQQRIIPSDARAFDRFGGSVDLADGLAAIGAPLDNNTEFDSGSVYVFDAATGAQIRKITPDGALNDHFGEAVAIGDGKVAAVSLNQGLRRVWVYDIATGALDFAIDTDSSGAPAFFTDVEIADGRLYAAFTAGGGTPQVGGVDAYDLQTGEHVRFYNAGNDPLADDLGGAVAADGNTLAVGARGDFLGVPGADPNGSVYVFNIDDGLIRHRLTPSAMPGDADRFGLAVAVDGGTVHVGSEFEILPGVGHGAIYAFDSVSGERLWRLASIEPGTPDDYITVGTSIAATGGREYAGGVRWVANTSTEGLVYVVTTPCNESDLAEPYAVLDLADVQAFVAAFVAVDPSGDLNGDGIFDLADLQVFIGAFTAGCP
jgi:outer membrane protein assembly factor BamB